MLFALGYLPAIPMIAMSVPNKFLFLKFFWSELWVDSNFLPINFASEEMVGYWNRSTIEILS